MHRLLERLDNAAAQIVPLLYLLGLALGAASYFAGITLDAGLAVGSALAIAAELHSFLQQRRLRASYAQLARLADDAPEREAIARQVAVNGWILAGLLAFSSYNAIAFTAATWRPIPGFIPGWLQIAIRGLVIPLLFFASGFLTPLHTDASEQLQTASADMLRRTLKAIARQWRGRLDTARGRGADLAGVAVALMLDAGDTGGARRIELIAQGLTTAERPQIAPPALEDATPAQPNGPDTGPQRPPTGPGSPAALAPIGGPSREQIAAAEQLAETWRGWPPERQTARRPATRPAASAAGVRTPRASDAQRSQPAARRSNKRKSAPARSGQSLEGEARLAWAAGARTVNTMMALGGMSRNAASGWVRTLKAEASQAELGRQAEREQANAGQLAQ